MCGTSFYAHSQNTEGHYHALVAHLHAVADRAREFAGKFGAADFGCWAGLWHDREKFHPDFQTYFISLKSSREPDHSTAEQDRH